MKTILGIKRKTKQSPVLNVQAFQCTCILFRIVAVFSVAVSRSIILFHVPLYKFFIQVDIVKVETVLKIIVTFCMIIEVACISQLGFNVVVRSIKYCRPSLKG